MAQMIDGKETVASVVALGDVVLAYTAIAIIGAQNMQLSVSVPSARAGDTLSIRATTAIPAGYDIGAAFCVTDGTVVVVVVVATPALALGASFSINARVFRVVTS